MRSVTAQLYSIKCLQNQHAKGFVLFKVKFPSTLFEF